MTPTKIFEGWISGASWGLALSFDFQFIRLYAQLGPLQGAINFTGEPNWKV